MESEPLLGPAPGKFETHDWLSNLRISLTKPRNYEEGYLNQMKRGTATIFGISGNNCFLNDTNHTLYDLKKLTGKRNYSLLVDYDSYSLKDTMTSLLQLKSYESSKVCSYLSAILSKEFCQCKNAIGDSKELLKRKIESSINLLSSSSKLLENNELAQSLKSLVTLGHNIETHKNKTNLNQKSQKKYEQNLKQTFIKNQFNLKDIDKSKPESKNVTKISNLLMSYVHCLPKKRKCVMSSNNSHPTIIGITPNDVLKIRKYKINPLELPKISNKFDKTDKSFDFFSATSSHYLTERNLTLFDKINNLSKAQVADQEREFAFKEREEKIKKFRDMSEKEKDIFISSVVLKHWQFISKKEVPKLNKMYTKYKMEKESNVKKFVGLCSKEVKKKALRTQKLGREAITRAKKLAKDALSFWKKKEKTSAEEKKRKERIEREIKKKEEEQKEALALKKKLEFLIRQSDIFSSFMARRLGITQDVVTLKPEDKVEIDEDTAKKNVQSMINSSRQSLRNFDIETQSLRISRGGQAGKISELEQIKIDELGKAANTFDNPENTSSRITCVPSIFKGSLKEYQLKGVKWLDNLYEMGINGILADEMGLGKTIEAICFLAHLAENLDNWGPFLIVAPASTLYNWQQEFKKFCPSLKVLPYWGTLSERKLLRKYFNNKNLYTKNSQFNVLVTSYQLIVVDEKSFHRVKWQYMILDEAQAIKNINSQRWKTLSMGFNCRNRLLMSGTPIQNSMAELWALLHFIMPKLFDNHDQFQEWFSKDIEAHSQNDKELNKNQLSRLHAVLKPFMLRRVKKDVEQEIAPKEEMEILCEMTLRQAILYQGIKGNASNLAELFTSVDSKQKIEKLMNLVMQLRKVCNHPELFERSVGRLSYTFKELETRKPFIQGLAEIPEIVICFKNPINYKISKLVYDELFNLWIPKFKLNIFSRQYLNSEFQSDYSSLGVLGMLGLSPRELEFLFSENSLIVQITLVHYFCQLDKINQYFKYYCDERNILKINLFLNKTLFGILQDLGFNSGQDEELVKSYPIDRKYSLKIIHNWSFVYIPKITTAPINYECSSISFHREKETYFDFNTGRHCLYGTSFKFTKSIFGSSILPQNNPTLPSNPYSKILTGSDIFEKGMIPDFLYRFEGSWPCELVDFSKLIRDSGKMRILDSLLKTLKAGGHKCLIFCQMTKMLDILEDFVSWNKYQYCRMDGSTQIADRRDMVANFQTNPNIFLFLLSTRAGGLGVTLTAADTVIFYDNDWNPTVDAQATDRVHRIGQTKKVTIYRLITRNSVEERIVKRAKQKQVVQSTVYAGGVFKADVFKPREVLEMLYDDDQKDLNFIIEKTKKVKRRKKMKDIKESNSGSSEISESEKNIFSHFVIEVNEDEYNN